LATAHLLIDQGRRSEIKGVAALVPITVHPKNVPSHHESRHRSYQECANGPVNTANAMATFLGKDYPITRYQGPRKILKFAESVEAMEDDPSVFVLLSRHLEVFPPTYIAVCEVDPLRDDGIIMGHILKEAG